MVAGLVEDLECQVLTKPQNTTPTQNTKVCADQEHSMQFRLSWDGVTLNAFWTSSTVSVISEACEFKYWQTLNTYF